MIVVDKKYQIFISSTYKDLIPERNKVRDVILSMYQFPIGMEMFSAADEEQWEIIKETIDSSDYYVLIIGKRYGSVIEEGTDKGVSFTEKEYRYAKGIGLPILVYIKDEKIITADNVEEDTKKLKKLQNFISDVKKGREVKWFSSTDQLGTEVSLSLHKEIDRRKRPGWIRSDSVDIEKSLNEIVELSKINRKLQEENKDLRVELEKIKKASNRRPQLSISLELTRPEEGEENPELYQKDDIFSIDQEGSVHLRLKKLSTDNKEAKYKKLMVSDIPPELSRYVPEESIRTYNQSLPSKEAIQEYFKEYALYLRVKENGIPITFFVNNHGTAKATDVNVSIDFPEEVRVFRIDLVEKYEEPKGPELPENPIETGRKRAELERAFALDLKIPDYFGGTGIDYSEMSKGLLQPMPQVTNMFESIEIQENFVDIEDKRGILHTRFNYFPGGYIVPIFPGEYEAKVTLMCAEYVDQEETTIKFIIEE